MTLDDLMRRHGEKVLGLTRQCAEDAVWHFADGSEDRDVRVVVHRQLLEPVNATGQVGGAVHLARVFIARNENNGVLRVAAGDEITLVMRVGAAASRCRIVEILSEDPGGFELQVMR